MPVCLWPLNQPWDFPAKFLFDGGVKVLILTILPFGGMIFLKAYDGRARLLPAPYLSAA